MIFCKKERIMKSRNSYGPEWLYLSTDLGSK